MNSQVSKDIIKDLYRRYNITEDQAREIVKSQFRKVTLSMSENSLDNENYPAIRLPKFGLFFVKQSKMKKYRKSE